MVTGLRDRIQAALQSVKDPEIPAVSVIDMGMIGDVDVDGATVTVMLLPTFTGCPAVSVIEHDIIEAVGTVEGVDLVRVVTTFDPMWTSDRITDRGRRKLRGFGIAPPGERGPVLIADIGLPAAAVCPFCGSRDTRNDNPFGPTPCRALYYCNRCRNPFEQFKPL